MENRFKTASVGGYVKADVDSYVESMRQEYRSKLSTLEKIVAATQVSRSELESRLQALELGQGQESGESERLKAMLAGLQGQLNEREQALQDALAEVEQMRAARSATEELEARLFAATSEVEKLHASQIELQQRIEQQDLENKTSQEELMQLRAELEGHQQLAQKLQEENAQLRQEIERLPEKSSNSSVSTTMLLDLQTQLDQRSRQMISLNQELELTREKCRNYEKAVGALEEVQDKASQIEAGAREKATSMVFAASQESDKLKVELDTWLSDIEASYLKIKQEAEQKVGKAYDELEKTKMAMDKLVTSRQVEDEMPKRHTFSVIPGYGDAKNA